MKCTVNAGEFLAALRSVQARAKHTGSIDILRHIRLDVANDRLTLLGHDMESCSIDTVEADDAEAGACCVPADPLVRLITGLPKQSTVIIQPEGTSALIKSGRSRYKLPILQADVFPDALVPEGGIRVTLSADDVKQLFERPAAGLNPKDERPIASGVWLHEEGGNLVSASYATYNLMRFATEIAAQGFAGVMVQKSTMDELARFGPGVLTISKSLISIENGARRYCSKLVEASFPESYRKTIPATSGAFVDVDRAELTSCLSRLASISDFSNTNMVDLRVEEGDLSLSLVGTADGMENMECDVSGAAGLRVCAPAQQLLTAVKIHTGDKLRIYMRGEMDPFRIVDETEPTAVNVQMPCLSKNREAQAA
jgi:DNA polymerase-3 subunit beta